MRSVGSSMLLPEVLLVGYRNGFFPMADSATGRITWHRPDPRAIIPLDAVHISRSLRKIIERGTFRVTIDHAFDDVIRACSERHETWISDDIVAAYSHLHDLGFAHSVESWNDDGLVGGLYGVHIGGAFFGESMFSRVSNASKVAFSHLAAHLRLRGFRLLDTQYINEFTASLGAIEIPDSVYSVLLADALAHPCEFP